jgi:hypothetical protein
MKRYGAMVIVCLLGATVAFTVSVGVKPAEIPPPIGLVEESRSRSGEEAGGPRTRAHAARARREARVGSDRRRSRPRAAAADTGDERAPQPSQDEEDDADTDDEHTDHENVADDLDD